MRWPRRVASLVALLLLLAVPPLVLVTVVGWPMHGSPDLQQVRAWVTQPLTEQTLTAAFTVLAWLIWLLVAYTATVSTARRVRAGARWLRRMPLPTPLQATATGMAGAAAFSATATATSTAPAEPALAVAAATLDQETPGPDMPRPAATGVPAGQGVTVAGGWLPRDTAEQVAAASALVWLRRRRDYQPGQPGAGHRDDSDLAPMPATAAAVQSALATDPAPPDSTVSHRPARDASHPVPAPTAALAPAGVAFTGPGALHAARGVLVTTLLATLRHPTGAARVIITDTALTALLGPTGASAVRDGIPGLRVTATAQDALALLESYTAHRAPVAPQTGDQRDAPETDDWLPLALITDAPASASRLAALLAPGRVTAVVLSEWPLGVTWHIDPQGHSHDVRQSQQAGPRLCVLDQAATTDLLTVISHTPTATPMTATTPARDDAPATAIPRPRQPHPVPDHSAAAAVAATAATRHVEVRVLGKPALLVNGNAVPIRRSAAVQALVFLAVHRHGANTRQLIEAIWPGLPVHTVTGRLYTTLSDLRGAVRDVCDLTLIDHTDDRYRLNPEHVNTDLSRLYVAAHHAATTLTDPSAGWRAVIDAYTGDLAAGHTWPWVEQPREATRRLVIDAYVAAASAQPDPRRALDLLQGGIRVDPYNEHLHHRAIDTLTALGDHPAAADLQHAYTRRLARAGLPLTATLQAAVTSGAASTQ